MKYIGIITTLLVLLSCQIETSYPEADWTLMFYLADDYSTIGLNLDVAELTADDVNTADIRIVILYDGAIYSDSELETLDSPLNSYSRTIDITTTNIPNTDGELDMADGETLEEFISYVKEKVPAENYALYLGSHGTGFQSGTSSGLAVENGYTDDNVMLTIEEIANAVSNNNGVEIVTFDACNIGTIETIYQFKGLTDYIIASPEEIPGPGNDYEGFVQAAYSLTDPTARNLSEATLQCYYNYYDENEVSFNSHEGKYLTNLYDVDALVTIIESTDFSSELENTMYNEKDAGDTQFNSGNYTDIFDLMTNTTLIESFNTAIINIEDIDNSVPTGEAYRWLSIYYPSNYNSDYSDTDFGVDFSSWVDQIR